MSQLNVETPESPDAARHPGDRDPMSLPSFAELFEQASRRRPDALAVDDGVERLTYRELADRSARLASAIQSWPDASDAPVAVLTGHDTAAVVAFVGVVRSGRPVVILDLSMPPLRLETIVRMSGAVRLVTDRAHADLARQIGGTTATVEELEDLAAGGDGRGPAPVDPGALAAVLFTSGSSGAPKGVMWSQRLLGADALSTGWHMRMGPDDRVALPLPISFAAGTIVLVSALAAGASVHLSSPRDVGAGAFRRWLLATSPTTLHLTPSMLRGLVQRVEAGSAVPGLRLVSACGEALYAADVAAARDRLSPDAVVLQWFGSSEGCSLAFLPFAPDDPLPESAIPVGRANFWRTFRVVDADGRDAPVGEAGDLVVTTPLLADGYWNDPERSAERFVRRPDGLWDLRTGDIGALDETGCLRLLGRSEAAVKIRGYFVDPSEIEAKLLASGRVSEAVVVAVQDDGPTHLVAYAVPGGPGRTTSVAELRARLTAELPTWMVPAHIVLLSALPKTERGKVDRQALPPVVRRDVVPPQGPVEPEVARIWAEVLGVAEVGRTENFFELGGDSLGVEEMLARIDDELSVSLRASDFTQTTNLADLALRVSGEFGDLGRARWPATAVRLRQGRGDRTVFCVAGGGSSVVVFAALAAGLDGPHSTVAFQGRGQERRAPAEWTVAGMVRRRLALVHREQPHGPYLLVGHSLGAILALEMARRLDAEGHQVLAVLADPIFTGTAEGRREGGGRVRRAGRLVKHGGRLLGLSATGLVPARIADERKLMFRQSSLVVRRYRPQPWNGRILAYRTDDNPDGEELWARLMPNAEVRRAACDHNALLRAPYVQLITSDVQAVLDDGWWD